MEKIRLKLKAYDHRVLDRAVSVIVDAVKQFIESGGEVGDVMIGQDWLVEFSLLRETVVRRDETGTEYCKTYLVAILRSLAEDESGTECKAAYRIVIDFDKRRILIQDMSGLVGLSQRVRVEDLTRDL